MQQYLVILLDDMSTSYCHYDLTKSQSHLIGLDDLKAGILFGMKENLMIQFVYPDHRLPKEYKEAMNCIDHSIIVSSLCEDEDIINKADVIIFHNWTGIDLYEYSQEKAYVLRTSKHDFFHRYLLLEAPLSSLNRLNIVFTDVETFIDEDYNEYKAILDVLSKIIEKEYIKEHFVQFNLLTDRMLLDRMNNCNAGCENITLAPDGKFYVCPAFYLSEDERYSIGDLQKGLDIKNPQLYRLDHAPLCRKCDAYQCKRCIWLNKKMTWEVNTPGHEACVIAHIERNASRQLLTAIRQAREFVPEREIPEIIYLDPFEMKKSL